MELTGAWEGCFIEGDTLVVANGEKYTAHELQFIRWELNMWRNSSRYHSRELKRSGKEGAVLFEVEELKRIRDAMKILDEKLPGYSIRKAVIDEVVPVRKRRRYY